MLATGLDIMLGSPSKKKKEQVNETTTKAFAQWFEEEFALVSIVSSCDSSGWEINRVWLVDNGTTGHMTGTWDIFLSISGLGPGWDPGSEGNWKSLILVTVWRAPRDRGFCSFQGWGRTSSL